MRRRLVWIQKKTGKRYRITYQIGGRGFAANTDQFNAWIEFFDPPFSFDNAEDIFIEISPGTNVIQNDIDRIEVEDLAQQSKNLYREFQIEASGNLGYRYRVERLGPFEVGQAAYIAIGVYEFVEGVPIFNWPELLYLVAEVGSANGPVLSGEDFITLP